MKETLLMDLGLSKNESKIYISLLEIGSSSATKIADASGIHRVNVYDSVHRLKDKGLVCEVSKNGKRQYQAAPPENLRNIIKEKEIKLNKIITQLQLSNDLNQNTSEVQLYEGWDFIRNIFIRFANNGKEIYASNIPSYVVKYVGQYFQGVIHKRRAEQKQWMYHIYSKEAVERMKFLNSLPYTKARYLDRDHDNAAFTLVCDDIVIIVVSHDRDEIKPINIFIHNKQVADTYRLNFLALWDKALDPNE
jgi:sugar-specific transcriptional regulator TrmB